MSVVHAVMSVVMSDYMLVSVNNAKFSLQKILPGLALKSWLPCKG